MTTHESDSMDGTTEDEQKQPQDEVDPHEQMLDAVEEILWRHVGEESAITSGEISDKLGNVDAVDSTPRTRGMIRELVFNREVPVVASTKGYYVVSSEDELDDYSANLANRAERIKDRRSAVVHAAYSSGMVDPTWGDESEAGTQAALGGFQ